jgi:hypothetical protein
MKKITTLFLCVLFAMSFTSLRADSKEDKHEKYLGLRAGWQLSGIYSNGKLPTGYDPLNSFYVGLNKDIKLIPLLRLGVGIEYSEVGMTSADSSIGIQYLYLPLYLKVKLGPVFALGGISPSFKIGDTMQGISPYTGQDPATFDAPVFLGLGIKILFLSIEARYNWGTVDVFDGAKNQYLQIGGAVTF